MYSSQILKFLTRVSDALDDIPDSEWPNGVRMDLKVLSDNEPIAIWSPDGTDSFWDFGLPQDKLNDRSED